MTPDNEATIVGSQLQFRPSCAAHLSLHPRATTIDCKRSLLHLSQPGNLATSRKCFEEIKQYRIGAEHTCRKILKPYSSFSLPIKYWYNRIHTFRDLIKLRVGNNPRMGKSRILRSARRLHILDAAHLSIDNCREGIRLSILQQKEVRRHDAAHQSQHLGNCLQSAMDSGDDTRIQAVKMRIRNERDKTVWRRINRSPNHALDARACR